MIQEHEEDLPLEITHTSNLEPGIIVKSEISDAYFEILNVDMLIISQPQELDNTKILTKLIKQNLIFYENSQISNRFTFTWEYIKRHFKIVALNIKDLR